MAKKKRAPKSVQMQLKLPPGETEVTIGGEQFSVKLRSSSPFPEIINHSLALYRACAPEAVSKPTVGFAGPGAGSADISPPTAPGLYPMDLDG